MRRKLLIFTIILSLLIPSLVFAIGSRGEGEDDGGSLEFDREISLSKENIFGLGKEGPVPYYLDDRFVGLQVVSKAVKGSEGNLRYRSTKTYYDVYLVDKTEPVKIVLNNLINYSALDGYNDLGDREPFYVSIFITASELIGLPLTDENQALAGSKIRKIVFNSDIETGILKSNGEFTNRPEYADYISADRPVSSIEARKADVTRFFGTREIIQWKNDAGHAFHWNQNVDEEGKPVIHTDNMVNWFGEVEINSVQGYNFINEGIEIDCAKDKAILTIGYESLGEDFPHASVELDFTVKMDSGVSPSPYIRSLSPTGGFKHGDEYVVEFDLNELFNDLGKTRDNIGSFDISTYVNWPNRMNEITDSDNSSSSKYVCTFAPPPVDKTCDTGTLNYGSASWTNHYCGSVCCKPCPPNEDGTDGGCCDSANPYGSSSGTFQKTSRMLAEFRDVKLYAMSENQDRVWIDDVEAQKFFINDDLIPRANDKDGVLLTLDITQAFLNTPGKRVIRAGQGLNLKGVIDVELLTQDFLAPPYMESDTTETMEKVAHMAVDLAKEQVAYLFDNMVTSGERVNEGDRNLVNNSREMENKELSALTKSAKSEVLSILDRYKDNMEWLYNTENKLTQLKLDLIKEEATLRTYQSYCADGRYYCSSGSYYQSYRHYDDWGNWDYEYNVCVEDGYVSHVKPISYCVLASNQQNLVNSIISEIAELESTYERTVEEILDINPALGIVVEIPAMGSLDSNSNPYRNRSMSGNMFHGGCYSCSGPSGPDEADGRLSRASFHIKIMNIPIEVGDPTDFEMLTSDGRNFFTKPANTVMPEASGAYWTSIDNMNGRYSLTFDTYLPTLSGDPARCRSTPQYFGIYGTIYDGVDTGNTKADRSKWSN